MVVDKDNKIYDWIIRKLDNQHNYPNTLTMGILIDGVIIGGVIYSVVNHICYLSIYTEDSRWCQKNRIKDILSLPFKHLGVKVIKCLTDSRNKPANKLMWGLKLKEEGLLRYARPNGSHERVFSLTENELKKRNWYR